MKKKDYLLEKKCAKRLKKKLIKTHSNRMNKYIQECDKENELRELALTNMYKGKYDKRTAEVVATYEMQTEMIYWNSVRDWRKRNKRRKKHEC